MDKYVYFKVAIVDITSDMEEKAINGNLFNCKHNEAGTHVMLKYCRECVSLDLYTESCTQLTKAEMKAEILTADWGYTA